LKTTRQLPLALVVVTGALGVLAGACTVGDGTGVVRGPIYLLGCTDDGANFGTKDMPRLFDLSPRFFAGEPIEDIAIALPANRLLMRIQRNGNRIEVNDTLYVDVQDAYEVARCVRGRTVGGVPDYLTVMTTSPITAQPTTTPWCDWSANPLPGDGGEAGTGDAADAADAGDADASTADADAGVDAGAPSTARAAHARLHLGTEEIVRASLSLLFTCHKADVVGVASDGWIDFQDFGSAAQPDRPPEMRDPVDRNFKVNFGERLRATFHIQLDDDRIYQAIKDRRPMPMPLTGGELGDSFDFDLERGRAAQPFP
jgi:hypothetical protein